MMHLAAIYVAGVLLSYGVVRFTSRLDRRGLSMYKGGASITTD